MRVLSKIIAIKIDDKLICFDRQIDNRQVSRPGYLIPGVVPEFFFSQELYQLVIQKGDNQSHWCRPIACT
jgi:hypothetical protein